ncbi:protein odr-4 homolog [Prorops nasuta]|uniref:protein odr-4 homolog n=1 Tax=Prorops nasuta TaxID=863751 RepID=UPI0034CFC9E1
MGRTIFIPENLFNYLISLTKPDGFTIGLILGQSAGQKDYVVHLTKSPPPAPKNVVEETAQLSGIALSNEINDVYIKSIKDIPANWLADHAKHVIRMLPGGMYILGIFIVGPQDINNDNSNLEKLKLLLVAIERNISYNKYLYGSNNEEQLILGFNSNTQKCTCRSVSKNGILKPAECKFQGKAIKWHQIETLIDFDQLFHISAKENSETLKNQLQNILEDVSELINSAVVFIEGEARHKDDNLETIITVKENKKEFKSNENKKANEKPLQASLYIPCFSDPNYVIKLKTCTASIRLVGNLVSRTFLHQKATIQEVTDAVKQDIIRSLASRLELHWDSLIEEENGLPEENITLHEPPRRILIALPESKITLSDYLFPGEGPQEALISLQELLDLKVHESNIQKEIEVQVDPSEFYCRNEMEAMPSDQSHAPFNNRRYKIYMTGLIVAFLVVLIAILVQLY